MRRPRLSTAVLALLWALPAWAFGVQPGPEGLRFVEEGRELSRLDVGAVRDVAVRGQAVYAALAAGGVVVVDATDPARPQVTGRLAEGRVIDRLLLSGEGLYLLEVRHEVIAFDVSEPKRPRPQAVASAPSPRPLEAPVAAPAAPAPTSPAPSAQAKVVDVVQGRVILDKGVAAGLRQGARVKIISQRLVAKPDLVTGGVREQPSNEVTAVLQIEQAEETRSMAALGRGDFASPGDVAELTDEPVSERVFLPRRAPFSGRVGFRVRPFLGLGTSSKPVGLLVDAVGSYYLEQLPARLELGVAPGGTAINSAQAHYPVVAFATAAYTTDFFEIGLGGGMLVGNLGPCRPGPPAGDSLCEDNTGFTLNQVLRLGALDGLYVQWQSSIFSRPDEFVFGVGRAEVHVPVTSRLGVFAAGGGGENGWAFGEFGVRTYVGGTGARGTTLVSASLGYAAIFDGPGFNGASENVGGPSVAFGMEWRY